MRSKLHTLWIIVLVLMAFPSFAQINLKGLKDKASNAMEDAIERKIEKEMNKAAEQVVNKYWERVLGKYYAGLYEGGTSGGTASFPYMIDENVELEEEYIFMHSVKMQVDTYKKRGKLDETVFIQTHVNDDMNYMGTSIMNEEDNSNSFVINDFKNKCLIILVDSDGQKMRLAYGLQLNEEQAKEMTAKYEAAIEEAEAEGMETIEPLSYETIGTKEILGHTCKGYRTTSEEEVTDIWMAHEDVFGMENLFGAKDMQNENRDKMIEAGYPMGSMMEVSNKDLKGNLKMVTQVVEISENVELKIEIADYPSQAELAAEEAEKED